MISGSGRSTRLSPMLSICTERHCTKVVFGRGSCPEHDPQPPPVTMHETLLSQAATHRVSDTGKSFSMSGSEEPQAFERVDSIGV